MFVALKGGFASKFSRQELETCGYKAKDITPSIAWGREAWKEEAPDDLTRKDERAIAARHKIGPLSKAALGKLLRDGVERMYRLFFLN